MSTQAFCKTCDSIQDVEPVADATDADLVFCTACGDEFNTAVGGSSNAGDDPYNNYVIGKVLKVEAIPKQKELKKILVDVTGECDEAKAVQIVTNAKYIEPNWLVVVAMENAVVPAGAVIGEDPDALQIKATSVGGVKSYGMVCDSPMLKWVGGAKGVVQQIPESAGFKVGDKPPATRPRS